MGLRTASVRRPYVVVMAPALTETSQTQNFKLTPEVHLQTSSLTNFDAGLKYLNSAKGTYLSDDSLDSYPLESNELSNVVILNSRVVSSEPLCKNKCLKNPSGASDNYPLRHFNMSNCSPSMGDQEEKMGLQKTGLDSVSTLHKTKTSASDVDHLINNLATGDIGQNVDEIMQVIKSMEGCNDRLNNVTNDMNSDEVFPLAAADLTNNLSSFEKELLNDVDMMSITIEDQPDELDAVNSIKETQGKELLEELCKKHAKVERKLDFLQRRIYKIQSRIMGQHVSSEVAGVFEYVHRSLKRLKELHDAQKQDTSSSLFPVSEHSSTEKLKAMSYGSTKTLIRKLEMTALLQANTASRQRNVARYFGSGSIEPPTFRNNVSGMINLPIWPQECKLELQKVSGFIQSELSVVQAEFDSEATDSSSGGESCDEMQTYSNPHQQYLSIQKRALWKYSTSRAAIAARWTWLQAQISDLEYRIRQHTDLHRQIRTSKGSITLGGSSPPASIPSSPTAVNGYRGQLPGNSPASMKTVETPIFNSGICPDYQCARTRPLVNFKKRKLLQIAGLHAVSKKAARPSTVRCGCVPPDMPCALCTGRTDPTHPRDPPETLSKAERIALLDPTFHPVFSLPEDTIVVFPNEKNRRLGNTEQRTFEKFEYLTMEQIEHEVLKSRDAVIKDMEMLGIYLESEAWINIDIPENKAEATDTSQSIHMEAIMKTSEWQQRSSRMKTLKLLTKAERMEKTSLEHRTKKLDHRKKYGRLLKSSTMSALSAKIRNKIRGRKAGRHSSLHRFPRKRHSATVAMAQLHSLSADGADEEVESIDNNSNAGTRSIESPSSSPLLQMQSISGYKKNRVHSYDIDNIVIPYSVAAATRVEKLQYKEILTPKWRIADPDFDVRCENKNNGVVRDTSQDSDVEDISDEAVIARHDRCEHDEKKKFLSYLKLPLGYGRARSHKRTDSRAESSGANTPDPMSPHPVDVHENTNSPIASPPATPLSVHTDDVGSLPSISILRRRTISQSRFQVKDKEPKEEIRCTTPEAVEVAPYETREFPLPEDAYDKMLKHMPEDHQFKTNVMSQDSGEVNLTEDYLGEKVDSPGTESTESALGDEDPNDPEWVDMERARDRQKR